MQVWTGLGWNGAARPGSAGTDRIDRAWIGEAG